MTFRSLTFAALLCALPALTACTGEIRETTSARAATEQLLISTAAQRAVKSYEPSVARLLKGKRVAIDDQYFVSVDKPYVVSAIRNLLQRNGATAVPLAPEKVKRGDKEVSVGPDLVMEIRSGALGIKDKDFGFGIPPLPLPIPNSNLTSQSPGLYFIFRYKQEGWAKFQLWLFEPTTRTYLAQSPDLWGTAYYSKWTFLGIGPFDFSEDIYPEFDPTEALNSAR